jgi:hypothetical protein
MNELKAAGVFDSKKAKLMLSGLMAALVLACGGCSSTQMKGTPFYSGEYGTRTGPAEQRVNLWPVMYYRDPALSVLWPVFEFTEDHAAVRPIYSVYGLDQSNRQFNALWPLVQFDYRTGRKHVFPVYWSSNSFSVFPLYWHHHDPWGQGSSRDALYPFYSLSRSPNHFSLYSPWPLVRQWSNKEDGVSGSMALPLYWNETDRTGSRFYSLPYWSRTETNGSYWRLIPPFYYEAVCGSETVMATPLFAHGNRHGNEWNAVIPLVYWNKSEHTLISPLWASWRMLDDKRVVAPWAASWYTTGPVHDDLWLLGGLAHASWGPNPKSHHVFPFYYRSAWDKTFLTPLFGWDKSGDGFFYPVTPLAGVYTGPESGSWVFPFYSYSRETNSGDLSERFLVLGGYKKRPQYDHSWIIPLYSLWNYGPLETSPDPALLRSNYDSRRYGTEFWSFPFCWYENQCRVSLEHFVTNNPVTDLAQTNSQLVRRYSYKTGAFPLWSYNRQTTPSQNLSSVKATAGLVLYDYQHEAHTGQGTNDYTRARVLWRLYHYERSNGDVSIDLFPGGTYDKKADGAKKVSFLWHLFRYERAANGAKKLDLLFLPVMRTSGGK